MSRDEIMYLQDIYNSCKKVLLFTEGFSQRQLIDDAKTYDAVVRNLEIIGEAAKSVSENLRKQIPDIEWRKIAGLRDILAHAYFGIDNDILWDIIQTRVPKLEKIVNAFLNKNQP